MEALRTSLLFISRRVDLGTCNITTAARGDEEDLSDESTVPKSQSTSATFDL